MRITVKNENLPDYLRSDAIGLEELRQFVRPPRLKIVQKASSSELQAQYDVGSVILTPQMMLVRGVQKNEKKRSTGIGEPFTFTPLFFFPEWLVVNPIQLRGQMPFVRERSLDPRSQIAALSRSPDTRTAKCPEDPQYTIRYIEALTFVVIVHDDGPLEATPVVMSFSKSEHKTGSKLAGLAQMRRIHIYGGNYEASTSGRSNDKGEWHGYDIGIPETAPFVTEEQMNAYALMHADLKAAHKESRIVVDYDDEEVEAPVDSKEF